MIFIDNKYTRIYYAIVNRAKSRVKAKGLDKHHIIPDSFYLHRKRKGRKGWLLGDPDTIENLVYLTPHEHFVCHLLLTKMVTDPRALHKVISAAAWIMYVYKANNVNVRITGRVYAKLRQSLSKSQSKNRKGRPGTTTGKKSWIKDGVTKFSIECPGPGWVLGSKKAGQDSKLKGRSRPAEVASKIAISSIGKPGTVRDKVKWNNGVVTKYAISQPGPEWVLGGLAKGDKFAVQKGKRHWNNGAVTKMSKDCPGPGYVLGRLSWAKQ